MDWGTLLVSNSPPVIDLAIAVARAAIGVCFIVHAMGKLGLVGPGNMQGFADWLASEGAPFAAIQARVAMLSELLGGAALVVGLLTRPACLLLIVTMIVAGKVGHKNAGYLITNDPSGAEYTINLAVICFVIFLIGPGTFSLDRLFF
jgi:putative oxidoreductase